MNKKENSRNSIIDDVSPKSLNINDFILQKQIGNGSFAKVYKIKEKITGIIFAAKIINQKLENDDDPFFINIRREVNIISKLSHPAILKFYGYSPINFKNKPKPVIITDFATNDSLKNLIQLERNNPINQKLNPTRKLIIIYGIASAMSYLHSHNTLHCDLKPDNILLDDFLYPKIADFGLSKITHLNKNSMTIKSAEDIKGTPIYMAPEILYKKEYTKAVDVYAFGIIVYEIITLDEPFSNLPFFSIFYQVSKGNRPDFKKPIQPAYRVLIEDCWAQDQNKRPTFDQILFRLTNDEDFISEGVEKETFLKFIEYIEGSEISFDKSAKIDLNDNHFDILYKFISQKNGFQINSNFYSKIFPYKEYINLRKECKDLVEEAENDPNKQFIIAQHLIEGQEKFPRNVQLGIKYLKLSMKSGVKNSAVYYCKMLIKGNEIPTNLQKVRKVIDNLLNKQQDLYLYLYGKLYKKEKSYDKSKKCFEKSIQLGNVDSIHEIAKMMFKGEGFPVDKLNAIQYYKMAIEKECIKSMYKYGMLLIKSEKDDMKNEGIRYIKCAADKGYSKAMYEYSMILKESQENELNKQEMIKYLKKAADQGNADAIYEYSSILSTYRKEDILILNI
ncbi:hypothetical protein M9Y10_000444 [Tritrichomonas musculus]|uniref:Protein kinase domain-containing protein n=1 Tax=Tritrichomonas musculus TaxID=1915356 RepID=A0ABR2L5Y7_9EUKA